jgi:YfiH family protein
VRHVFPSGEPFDRIVAAFTTRRVRTTDLPEEDFNTGLHTGDDPIHVLENRRRIFGTLNLEFESFTSARQVHGSTVCRVTETERGKGAHGYEDAIPATDALITDLPGVPIGVFTADCVPIFLYDPARMAVGVVHAGWRSTALEIGRIAVEKMKGEFGSNPADMWAAFGPSIGPCCYEVGCDVFEAFAGRDDSPAAFQKTGEEKWHLDLWLANRCQLEAVGLESGKIIETKICSACNADEYFSARKLGSRTGRTLSVIAIKTTAQ